MRSMEHLNMNTETKTVPKTYKREVAGGVLAFWAGLIIWGHAVPGSGAEETGQFITLPVLMLVGAAFGIDAVLKQSAPAAAAPSGEAP